MSALALDYSYTYLQPSQLDPTAHRLQLATSSVGGDPHPYFFCGKLVRPKRVAEMLRKLMEVVRSRYHIPAAMLNRILAMSDPIVTSSDDRLRFEGFSSCCGVYVRVDLHPRAVDGETFGRGTTNVDFNEPMLAALALVREQDEVSLSVGAEHVTLAKNGQTVVEKRVKLPYRWLRGLVEVQACQSRMRQVHQVSGVEARRFFRSLPRGGTGRSEMFVTTAGSGLRLAQRETTQQTLVGDADSFPRDYPKLMELLLQLSIELELSITHPECRAMLEGLKGSGKGPKLAKDLLKLTVAPESGPRILELAVQQRISAVRPSVAVSA